MFVELVEQADVVVENFRSQVKDHLGFDYESLHRINERIILASISGFGQTGPYCERRGVDQIVQGMSGLMSVTGHKGQGPVRAGVAISDTTAGMFLGQGILLALIQRERTGRGDWVHTSLLEGMLCKLDFQGARFTVSGEVPEQQGNDHPTIFPMGTFKCKDGYVNIAASTDKMWQAFVDSLEGNQLVSQETYRTARGRMQNKDQLRRDIELSLRQFCVDDLVNRLNAAGVPCGPVNTIREGFENPQAKHLKMTKTASHKRLGDIHLIRSPIQLMSHPHSDSFERSAPDAGEHTREVLAEFGFDAQRIDSLLDSGAVSS